VFHRLPDRICAHALICFIALVLYRVIRMRLKDADSKLSPERALEELRRIQYHQVHLSAANAATARPRSATPTTPSSKD
jgi:transposase